MNYQRIHDQIIARARSRRKPDGYCERHHVVMKSMGGDDNESNLVWLTAREHYLVHWMLFKIHRNKETVFAWYRMTFGRKTLGRYTSHTFSYAKVARALKVGEMFRGRTLSDEHRQKLRAAKLGRTYADMGRDPATSRKGQKLNAEQRERVAAASRGRKWSDESREKARAGKLGPMNHRYGVPVSEETKQKLSAALRAFNQLKKEQE